jgi:hypothetical protein
MADVADDFAVLHVAHVVDRNDVDVDPGRRLFGDAANLCW